MSTDIRRAAYNRIVSRAWFAGESIDHDLAGSLLVEGVISRLYRKADENRWRPWTGTLGRRSCLYRYVTRGDKSVSRRLWDAILDRLIEEGLVAEVVDAEGKGVSVAVHDPARLKVADGGVIERLITDQELESLSSKADSQAAENTPKRVPDRVPDREGDLARIPCAHQTANRKPHPPEFHLPNSQHEFETEHEETRGSSSQPTPPPPPEPVAPEADPGFGSGFDSGLRVIEGSLSWTGPQVRRLFETAWSEARPGVRYKPATTEAERATEVAALLAREGWTEAQFAEWSAGYIRDHAAGQAWPEGRRTGVPQLVSVLTRHLKPAPPPSPAADEGQIIDGYWYSAEEVRRMRGTG